MHHTAHIDALDDGTQIDLTLATAEGWDVQVRVRRTPELRSSVFGSIEAASGFFRTGAIGYSARRNGTTLDALRLETGRWQIRPLAIETARSEYFEDRALFPEGAIALDCALLMENVEHEWRRVDDVEGTVVA